MRRALPLLSTHSRPGRRGADVPCCDVPLRPLEELVPAAWLRREAAELPEVSQPDLARHYTLLSQRNYGTDSGFYPLGSCTMKYNPKVNDAVAVLPGFARLHPLSDAGQAQGALELMASLADYLAELSGMEAVTFQSVAGAHGELLGLKLIRAYHRQRGEDAARTKVIVPDSAHGTNPASATVCGLQTVHIASKDGLVDLEALAAAVGPDTAAFMLTNPNTLGLFESQIAEIARLVHEAGGLLYYDGANANAILGLSRAGDMGFDVVHFNLHKTFSTPHGGGGPGAGAVGVKALLEPFLPVPRLVRTGEGCRWSWDAPLSVGRIHAFWGNFGVLVRAYAYIRSLGAAGLRQVSEDAVLSANYCRVQLKEAYPSAVSEAVCLHECVLSAAHLKHAYGLRALDVAKRLLDYGMHPPTVYFPLIVEEALMVEPTETESKETLDAFIAAMLAIAGEAAAQPERLRQAPQETVVGRLDEATAARRPVLRW